MVSTRATSWQTSQSKETKFTPCVGENLSPLPLPEFPRGDPEPPPCESEGWTIHFIERETRYWIAAQAGQKQDELFRQGTASAWQWAEPAEFICWFTDGQRRYGTSLWQLASVPLNSGEAHPDYGRRKVWREGLEVAMKIKGSQGHQRVEWVKVEHPFTAISPEHEVHANHCGSAQSVR